MKLKLCPFCGGEAAVWSGNIDDDCFDVYYDVYCMDCNCMTPKFHTEESAIVFWNRREPIDKIVEQLEETFDRWGLDEGKKEIMREIVMKGGVSNE